MTIVIVQQYCPNITGKELVVVASHFFWQAFHQTKDSGLTAEQLNSTFAQNFYAYLEVVGRDDLIQHFRSVILQSTDPHRSVENIVRMELVNGGVPEQQADQIIVETRNIDQSYKRQVHFLNKRYPRKIPRGSKPVSGGLPSLGKRGKK